MDEAADSPDRYGVRSGSAGVRPGHHRSVMADFHPRMKERACRALAQLSPLHREVVQEVCVRGLSLADAAAVLGLPVATVKERLSHALRAFRERLVEGDC